MRSWRKNGGLAGMFFMAVALGVGAGCEPVNEHRVYASSPAEIKSAIEHSTAPLTLVHVWATWCAPCRDEFPELLQAFQDTRKMGLALQLVSADDPAEMEAVKRFLQAQKSPVGTVITTELDEDFIKLFSPNWSGALPASFFFDAEGNLVAEWQGKRSYAEYYETIQHLLNP